jgi:hypothetical protein
MPRFSLADMDREEGVDGDGLGEASMAASLAGLTILPAIDSSEASYGMIGVGSGRTPLSAPAVRSRLGFLGGFSVAIGLTSIPSLRSAPPALGAGGGDVWGGGGWRPSMDTNAIGKSKLFQLVLHEKWRRCVSVLWG